MIKYVHSEINTVLRSKLNNMLVNETLVCKIPDGVVMMKAKLSNKSCDIMVAIEIAMDDSKYTVSGGVISTQMALDLYGELVSHAGNEIEVK